MTSLGPCRRFLNENFTREEIEEKRERIYQQINSRDVSTMTDRDLENLFWLYDEIFLNHEIRDYFSSWNPESTTLEVRFGEFGQSGQMAHFGTTGELIDTLGISGHCRVYTGPGFCHHALYISRPIHENLFRRRPGVVVENTNGLQCRDQLKCLMITLEHEIVHLVVNIWCRSQDDAHGGHFMTLVHNLFGHSDFRHSLGRGLRDDPQAHIVKVKEYLRQGMLVRLYDPWAGEVVMYRVVQPPSSKDECIVYDLRDGQYYPRSLLDVLLPDEV